MRRIRQGRPGHVNLGIIAEIEDDEGKFLGGKFRKVAKKQKIMAQDIIDEII